MIFDHIVHTGKKCSFPFSNNYSIRLDYLVYMYYTITQLHTTQIGISDLFKSIS